jgi:DNA-binding Xre family transcriptional regulator
MIVFNLIKEHSTKELARKTGLAESTIRRIKKTHSTKVDTMVKILNALGLNLKGDPIKDVKDAMLQRKYSYDVISKISGVPVSTIQGFIYSGRIPLWHNMAALGQALDVKFYKDF